MQSNVTAIFLQVEKEVKKGGRKMSPRQKFDFWNVGTESCVSTWISVHGLLELNAQVHAFCSFLCLVARGAFPTEDSISLL
mmetsp:Transcript_10595/g.30996  ORF Transcript_10595/g.30996 Transcript_10595/m.30996 type:complete len:81 (+) Transcript_10595:2500-2742(+)